MGVVRTGSASCVIRSTRGRLSHTLLFFYFCPLPPPPCASEGVARRLVAVCPTWTATQSSPLPPPPSPLENFRPFPKLPSVDPLPPQGGRANASLCESEAKPQPSPFRSLMKQTELKIAGFEFLKRFREALCFHFRERKRGKRKKK